MNKEEMQEMATDEGVAEEVIAELEQEIAEARIEAKEATEPDMVVVKFADPREP